LDTRPSVHADRGVALAESLAAQPAVDRQTDHRGVDCMKHWSMRNQ